ncbi:MAG: enoyl-CoA hydratase/isomerase family protein [Euryarchaeota archaeon]|nr:enoyl-CoA hydratase/isomerase family protein [Euryarchaeota archaeon]
MDTASYKNIILDVKENVATLYLNRPMQLNVLNEETLTEIDHALDAIAINLSVKIAVLRSNCKKAFTAGADVREMREKDVQCAVKFAELGHRIGYKLEKKMPPVIAVLNGYVLGGGLEIASACDLRIATPDAVFAQPEIDIGIIPGWGGTQRLCRLIGLGRAKELIYMGKRITAEEALEIGLVNMVVSHDKLDDALNSLCSIIKSKSRIALMAAKRAIEMNVETSLDIGLSYEVQTWATLFATYDQKEGMTAFLEKRVPHFIDK